MSVTLYGIPNCDTVKKARTWLADNAIEYRFHDYKRSGIDAAHLARWAESTGWEPLLNRAGTTFRKLDDADKAGIDQTKAIRLMVDQPSMIKRPVVEYPGGILVGFEAEQWARALL
jgi:arsenate reductase (glutaredoxin)